MHSITSREEFRKRPRFRQDVVTYARKLISYIKDDSTVRVRLLEQFGIDVALPKKETIAAWRAEIQNKPNCGRGKA